MMLLINEDDDDDDDESSSTNLRLLHVWLTPSLESAKPTGPAERM